MNKGDRFVVLPGVPGANDLGTVTEVCVKNPFADAPTEMVTEYEAVLDRMPNNTYRYSEHEVRPLTPEEIIRHRLAS